jgi:hypothetical protein
VTFHQFLRARENEDSPIGDLAQDLRRDRRRGWRVRVTPDSLRTRIAAVGGCSEALRTVGEAEDEWRRAVRLLESCTS